MVGRYPKIGYLPSGRKLPISMWWLSCVDFPTGGGLAESCHLYWHRATITSSLWLVITVSLSHSVGITTSGSFSQSQYGQYLFANLADRWWVSFVIVLCCILMYCCIIEYYCIVLYHVVLLYYFVLLYCVVSMYHVVLLYYQVLLCCLSSTLFGVSF